MLTKEDDKLNTGAIANLCQFQFSATFKSGSQQGSELHVCVSMMYDYYFGLILANYVNMAH